jgi:hypothetical protein
MSCKGMCDNGRHLETLDHHVSFESEMVNSVFLKLTVL